MVSALRLAGLPQLVMLEFERNTPFSAHGFPLQTPLSCVGKILNPVRFDLVGLTCPRDLNTRARHRVWSSLIHIPCHFCPSKSLVAQYVVSLQDDETRSIVDEAIAPREAFGQVSIVLINGLKSMLSGQQEQAVSLPRWMQAA